jgi:hypothetical protein
MARAWPSLFEYLTAGIWDDGTPRLRSTLLVFSDGPSWKVCLIDKATQRKAFVSAQTFQEAMMAMETGLTSQTLDWRRDRPLPGPSTNGQKRGRQDS